MEFNPAAGPAWRLGGIRGPDTEVGPTPAADFVHEEVNHRLANSLQLISALISVEARDVSDPAAREALEATRRRIVAIAEVHRRLYPSGAEEWVDLAQYLEDLAADLERGFGGYRRIEVLGRPAVLSPQRAAAVGVIVTEVVINACKHAYEPDEPGVVHIQVCSPRPDRFALEIRDYGRGRPSDGDLRVDGAGARIVDVMARHLGAEHAYLPIPQGTRFALSAPLADCRSMTGKTYV
jgi:two-component sensor histidine kinase